MSTKISKKRFVELLRTIIKREIEEASTTATAGGAYDTPRAFSGKGTKMGVPLDRRDSVASGSGFQKVEEQESVNEDTKDIVQAKKLTRKLQNVEGKYRKAMYDLSDRLQADPKNHKLQDDLVKSYTKNVTSFMRDMVKLTKRMK